MIIFPLLQLDEMQIFRESLLFLHVSELREVARRLSIPDKGTKIKIIARIVHFIQTSEVLSEAKLPNNSYAQKGNQYPLEHDTLILKGAYKNDLKTRLFFKQLIGEHFHFTAFGIDWINERWLNGNPPSYQEFSNMWQAEVERRKKTPEAPKEEWAYINFTQQFLKQNPTASNSEIIGAWKREHQRRKVIINEILAKIE